MRLSRLPVECSHHHVLLPGQASSGGGGEGRGGTHITNLICFLQHKWELARASPLASGTGPTPLPRCSSMCQAPSLLFPRASVSMTCGFQLS